MRLARLNERLRLSELPNAIDLPTAVSQSGELCSLRISTGGIVIKPRIRRLACTGNSTVGLSTDSLLVVSDLVQLVVTAQPENPGFDVLRRHTNRDLSLPLIADEIACLLNLLEPLPEPLPVTIDDHNERYCFVRSLAEVLGLQRQALENIGETALTLDARRSQEPPFQDWPEQPLVLKILAE